MVTNTANENTASAKVKENGENDKEASSQNEYSNVKQSSEESMKTGGTEKNSHVDHNDMANKMTTASEKQNFAHVPVSNGFQPNVSYTSTGIGNGGTHAPVTANGPQPNGPYPGYGSYPQGPQKQASTRPVMHTMPPGYMHGRGYAASGAPPQSLGQLLAAPVRFTGQYPNYPNHGNTSQGDYSQNSQQGWSGMPPQVRNIFLKFIFVFSQACF